MTVSSTAVRQDNWIARPISQEITDTFLRTGSGKRYGRHRILVFITGTENRKKLTDFIRKEYGRTSIGLMVDGNPYSMLCDENGMHIAHGKTALTESARHCTYTYEEVTDMLVSLVREGKYARQEIVDCAKDVVASKMAECYVSAIRNIPESVRTYNSEIKQLTEGGKYDKDYVEGVKSYVLDSNNVGKFVSYMEYINDAGEFGEDSPVCYISNGVKKIFRIMRAYYTKEDVKKILETAQALAGCICIPPTSPSFIVEDAEIFITDDEVETRLKEGSGISEGKYRIYSYFTSGHTEKEKTDFLKKEYGIGGSCGIWGVDNSYENHDAGGIELTRGSADGSIMDNDTITRVVKWSEVNKRISALIGKNAYLSEEEKNGLEDYEKQIFARNVHIFFSFVRKEERPAGTALAIPYYNNDAVDSIKEEYFSSTEKERKLLSLMRRKLDCCRDDSRLEEMETIIENFHNYIEGAYTLFPQKARLFKKDIKPKETDFMQKIDFKSMEQMDIFNFIS